MITILWFLTHAHAHTIPARRPKAEKPERIVCRDMKGAADPRAALVDCIAKVADGGTVEMPVGVYTFQTRLLIDRPITLTTEGTKPADGPCAADGSDCAEIAVGNKFSEGGGVLVLTGKGNRLDRVSVDGRRDDRSAKTYEMCTRQPNPDNGYGMNVQILSDECEITRSVFKYAACGTSLGIYGKRTKVKVAQNRIFGNGVHDKKDRWSDGLTVHDASDSVFEENEIADNTDVDLIFGGCQRCIIRKNTVRHKDDWASASFVAFMLQGFEKSTSADYTGTVVSDNTVDCGKNRNCGFGLYLGSSAWYAAHPTKNLKVVGNKVGNAQSAVVIDDVENLTYENNGVESSDRLLVISPLAKVDRKAFGKHDYVDVSRHIPNMTRPKR